jgi:putative tricarboxylic transport membrane protein
MKINDSIWGVLLVLLGAVIVVHVQDFPSIPGQKIGPGMFPGLAAAGLCLCGAVLVASGLRERRRHGHLWWESGDWMGSTRHLAAFFIIIAGVAAYIAFANAIGFLILAPVVLAGWFLVVGVKPATAALTAIVASLVIWYVFYKLLRVPLPWGLLTRFAF